MTTRLSSSSGARRSNVMTSRRNAGMSRGRFLRTTGVGAAAFGASATGFSGLSHATAGNSNDEYLLPILRENFLVNVGLNTDAQAYLNAYVNNQLPQGAGLISIGQGLLLIQDGIFRDQEGYAIGYENNHIKNLGITLLLIVLDPSSSLPTPPNLPYPVTVLAVGGFNTNPHVVDYLQDPPPDGVALFPPGSTPVDMTRKLELESDDQGDKMKTKWRMKVGKKSLFKFDADFIAPPPYALENPLNGGYPFGIRFARAPQQLYRFELNRSVSEPMPNNYSDIADLYTGDLAGYGPGPGLFSNLSAANIVRLRWNHYDLSVLRPVQ